MPLRAIEHAGDRDSWHHVRIRTRFERVAAQVAERLAQQDLVAFDLRELPGHDDLAAARRHIGRGSPRRRARQSTRMSTGVSTSSVGLAKFRKFVTT